jgi:hypothetical protein
MVKPRGPKERRAKRQEQMVTTGDFLLGRFPFIRPPAEALTRVLDRLGAFG